MRTRTRGREQQTERGEAEASKEEEVAVLIDSVTASLNGTEAADALLTCALVV